MVKFKELAGLWIWVLLGCQFSQRVVALGPPTGCLPCRCILITLRWSSRFYSIIYFIICHMLYMRYMTWCTWNYMTVRDTTWHVFTSSYITLHDMHYATGIHACIAGVLFALSDGGAGYPDGLVSFQAWITSKERSQSLLSWHLFWVFLCSHWFRTFLLK